MRFDKYRGMEKRPITVSKETYHQYRGMCVRTNVYVRERARERESVRKYH
jgi:hypothetical protein